MNRLRLGLRRSMAKHVTRRGYAKAAAALPAGHPLHEGAAYPAPVVGESLFNRSDAPTGPTFTPRPPAHTQPIAGLAPTGTGPRIVRPFISAGAPKTLLFDALAAERPLPPVMSAGEVERLLLPPRDEPGCAAALYCEPGWTQTLTAARVHEGWWEDPQAGLDQIATRVAAGFTTARGHVRETLGGAWRSIGVRELADQAPQGTGPQHAAGGSS